MSCEVNVTGNDENGRLAFARVGIFNHKLVFTSVYCPNEPDFFLHWKHIIRTKKQSNKNSKYRSNIL
jgi:hypothetical protein